jgi:hypothetical protein
MFTTLLALSICLTPKSIQSIKISFIKPGMSKCDVCKILGSPISVFTHGPLDEFITTYEYQYHCVSFDTLGKCLSP